jgi:acetoin utilization deacetylase AcuC-like enzyme
LSEIERHLARAKADIIGVSAGFDNHMLDWGGLLTTEDYHTIGRMVFDTCKRLGIGAFGILEGGYNHDVLGKNVAAFLKGFEGRPYDG